MYAFIRGVLFEKRTDCAIIDACGVGYRVNTSLATLARLPAAGEEVLLHTRLLVREDAHALYGFLTREELGMFEALLPVPKIGPKAALSLLSSFSPSQFGLAVLTDDYRTLSTAKGVGLKSAQAIVLSLKDKLRKERALLPGAAFVFASAKAPALGTAAAAADGSPPDSAMPAQASLSEAARPGEDGMSKRRLAQATPALSDLDAAAASAMYSDAVSALVILGYSPLDASEAVAAAYAPGSALEEIVREALRHG